MSSTRVPLVTILTGPRGGGKSTFCRSLVQHQGVAGVVSPARVDGKGRRFGFDAYIAPEGEQFPLARVVDPEMAQRRATEADGPRYLLCTPPAGEELTPTETATGVTLGPYVFSDSALTRVADALRRVASDPVTRLLVLDEIGPLEIKQNRGVFEPLRDVLRGTEGRQLPLLLVVRPSLVVAVSRLVQEFRPGAVPETVGVGDLQDPEDARILKSLL